MKRILEVALGIITGLGGFLEAGSLATSVQAGADFRFQLLWAVLLGAVCLAFICEMAGRFAAISKHTIPDAIRERFGFRFFLLPFVASLVVLFLVLASELGAAALALQYATGVSYRWWGLPLAALAWFVLWRGSFGLIEKGVSLLGLVTIAFVIGALELGPPAGEVGRGFIPSLPGQDGPRYWLLAVSIMGASVSPYLFFFYSSGAVEGRWDVSYLGINRVTAGLGMGFGGVVAAGALVLAALVLHPRGISLESYEQAALLLPAAFPHWGFVLFVLSLGIACFGAALDLGLTTAYTAAQGLGWNWSEDQPPARDTRFSLTYTLILPLAALPVIAGMDVLKLTLWSMVLTAATLPLTIGPLFILMNDRRYVGEYRNGPFANVMVGLIIAIACILALVALPLQLVGG